MRSLAYLMATAIVEMVVGATAMAILTARLAWLVARVIRTIGS